MPPQHGDPGGGHRVLCVVPAPVRPATRPGARSRRSTASKPGRGTGICRRAVHDLGTPAEPASMLNLECCNIAWVRPQTGYVPRLPLGPYGRGTGHEATVAMAPKTPASSRRNPYPFERFISASRSSALNSADEGSVMPAPAFNIVGKLLHHPPFPVLELEIQIVWTAITLEVQYPCHPIHLPGNTE